MASGTRRVLDKEERLRLCTFTIGMLAVAELVAQVMIDKALHIYTRFVLGGEPRGCVALLPLLDFSDRSSVMALSNRGLLKFNLKIQ
jgi:hypothetical protein